MLRSCSIVVLKISEGVVMSGREGVVTSDVVTLFHEVFGEGAVISRPFERQRSGFCVMLEVGKGSYCVQSAAELLLCVCTGGCCRSN